MNGKVYAVTNRKGGTGKTTTAISLAHGVALRLEAQGLPESERRVLVVDLDPQGHVAGALGVDSGNRCISQILLNQRPVKEVIMSAALDGRDRSGLWLIPAANDLADAKVELIASAAVSNVTSALKQHGRKSLPQYGGIDKILTRYFEPLKTVFSHIILDCPPTLDLLQMAVYDFADYAIVPVRADFLAWMGTIQQTADILESQGEVKISIAALIPTFVKLRQSQSKGVLKELQSKFSGAKITVPIPDTVRLAEAPEYGMTIYEYADYKKDQYSRMAAAAYMKVTEAIL